MNPRPPGGPSDGRWSPLSGSVSSPARDTALASDTRDTPAPSVRPQRRMLVVDNEPSILFAVGEYFSTREWEVTGVQDAEAAMGQLQHHPYAVLIADLRLIGVDDMQGLDVVAFARTHSPSTRIVVLTAYGSGPVEAEARRRGAEAFLHKPLPLSQLARIVEDLVDASGGGDPAHGSRPRS